MSNDADIARAAAEASAASATTASQAATFAAETITGFDTGLGTVVADAASAAASSAAQEIVADMGNPNGVVGSTLSATNATQIRQQAGRATPTPPSSPVVGQVWVSNAFADVTVSPSSPDRPVVIGPGTGEGNAVQEPCVWVDATHYRMLSTGGNGLQYRICPIDSDPLVAANWTRIGPASNTGPVLGQGVLVTQITHASIYLEGEYVYAVGPCYPANNIQMFRAPKSNPATGWESVGILVASLPAGSSAWGNTFLVKDDDGSYVLFLEHQVANGRWQFGQMHCATLGGTYAWDMQVMTSIYPRSDWSMAGGPWVTKENGRWVMWYHVGYGQMGNLPTEIFRATAPSLRADNWTVSDVGRPAIRRVGKFEVDQVADVELVRAPNGIVYAFWAGNDNRTPFVGRIYGTACLPVRRTWDGTRWVRQDPRPLVGDGLSRYGSDTGITSPTRPVLATVKANFSQYITTAGAWYEVPELGTVYTPTGSDVEVEFIAQMQLEGTAAAEWVARVKTHNAFFYPVAFDYGQVGKIGRFVGRVRVPRLTPGAAVPITVEISCSEQNITLRCQPVSFPGKHHASMKITEIPYP